MKNILMKFAILLDSDDVEKHFLESKNLKLHKYSDNPSIFMHHDSESYGCSVKRGESVIEASYNHPLWSINVSLEDARRSHQRPFDTSVIKISCFDDVIGDKVLFNRYCNDEPVSIVEYDIIIRQGLSLPGTVTLSEHLLAPIDTTFLLLGTEPRYNYGREIVSYMINSDIPFYAFVNDRKNVMKYRLLCSNNSDGFVSYRFNAPAICWGLVP
jgi:hypothetical protein